MARPNSSLKKDAFRKRKKTIIKKAHELFRCCQAQVYVVIRFHGRHHVYTSEKSRRWPPTSEAIATSYPPLVEEALEDQAFSSEGTKQGMREGSASDMPSEDQA